MGAEGDIFANFSQRFRMVETVKKCKELWRDIISEKT